MFFTERGSAVISTDLPLFLRKNLRAFMGKLPASAPFQHDPNPLPIKVLNERSAYGPIPGTSFAQQPCGADTKRPKFGGVIVMTIYKRHVKQPFRWLVALIIFLLILGVTFDEVYGLVLPGMW
jgi:hypothetical protein